MLLGQQSKAEAEIGTGTDTEIETRLLEEVIESLFYEIGRNRNTETETRLPRTNWIRFTKTATSLLQAARNWQDYQKTDHIEDR